MNNPLFKNIPHVGSFWHLVICCICVFVYLYLCICAWDTWKYQFWYPWTKSFQKMYGLYGLKHHTVEMSRDATDGRRRTREDKATQPLDAGRLSFAIQNASNTHIFFCKGSDSRILNVTFQIIILCFRDWIWMRILFVFRYLAKYEEEYYSYF